jgi:uncharacterized protein involved in high-affinity Fe2+ transport
MISFLPLFEDTTLTRGLQEAAELNDNHFEADAEDEVAYADGKMDVADIEVDEKVNETGRNTKITDFSPMLPKSSGVEGHNATNVRQRLRRGTTSEEQ